MIILKTFCAICGREHPDEIMVEKVKELSGDWVRTQLELSRWIVQFNGDCFDAYCSEECAR